MHREEISIAKAKTHFSEMINKVVYGHEEIIITKRGKPVAVITAPEKKEAGLTTVKGWLNEDDAFFKEMDSIIKERHSKGLRAAKVQRG
jgi:prevent-host-death family protein